MGGFGAPLGSLGTHLGSFSDRFEVVLGSFGVPFGICWGSFWDLLGKNVGSPSCFFVFVFVLIYVHYELQMKRITNEEVPIPRF